MCPCAVISLWDSGSQALLSGSLRIPDPTPDLWNQHSEVEPRDLHLGTDAGVYESLDTLCKALAPETQGGALIGLGIISTQNC